VIFTDVAANLKVVVVGTVVTVIVPLNGLPTPSTTTTSPTTRPCAVEVVNVATFEVKTLFVMANTFWLWWRKVEAGELTSIWPVIDAGSVPHLIRYPVTASKFQEVQAKSTDFANPAATKSEGVNVGTVVVITIDPFALLDVFTPAV
jgi:hypothetical protein